MKFRVTSLLLLFFTSLTVNYAAVAEYPAEVASDSPAAYYRFSETSGAIVDDASVNNRPLYLLGNYTRNVPELLLNATTSDKSAAFAGGFGKTASNWYTTTTGVSVSLMVKFNSLAGVQDFFAAGFQNSPSNGYHKFYYHGGVKELKWIYNYADGSAGANQASAEWTPIIGQTYHLAAVHDYAAKNIKIYVDGKLLLNTNHPVAARPLANAGINFFSNLQATIDEFALFGKPLSPDRIRAQFAASRGADAAAAAYYASPNGSIYGRGTAGDPLDLPTLLDFSLLQPGRTGYLKGGQYTGIFTTNLSGTSGVDSRIRLRSAPGETATLDGAGLQGNVLTLTGSYLDVSHLVIRKTWAVRENSQIGSTGATIAGTNGTVGGAGIVLQGANIRVFLNVIHDVVGDGVGFSSTVVNPTLKQNLIFNNGWYAPRNQEDVNNGVTQPNGHGVYAQNKAPSAAVISDNIFFNAYGCPIKIAGSGASFVQNFRVEGNVTVNGGFSSLIGGSSAGVSGLIFNRNKTWNNGFTIGYGTPNNIDVTAEYNYLQGDFKGFDIQNFLYATIRRNEIIPVIGSNDGANLRYYASGGYANWKTNGREVNYNIYWNASPAPLYDFYFRPGVSNPTDGGHWNQYLAETGFDANSTYHQSADGVTPKLPTTNKVFVEKQNEFESNRGRVIVYNWTNKQTQTVSLSSVLPLGTTYEIRSATNYFAGPIASGVYNGGTVTLPLTIAAGLPPQALPYGDNARGPEPSPKFAMFMIIPTGAAASQ